MSTVIRIENLWKEYRLGVIGHGTLTADLQSWWAKMRGKEDPNSMISALKGQEKQIEGDRFWALRGIELEVKQGEILGIIGKNGAGKSTLLKILSRVTAPTKGSIKAKGRIASLLEVGTGFHPELTGRENIFLNGVILGMSKQEIRSKFDEIVDFSGIGNFIETPVKRYSSGMYVRLAFAVAAHLEPEIMIVDEVLAVGDVEFQDKCMGKMDDLSKTEGRTVIFVSHNMRAVRNLCRDCLVIESGKVTAKGNADNIVSTYENEFRKTKKFSQFSIEKLGLKVLNISLNKKRGGRVLPFEPLSIEIEINSFDSIDSIGLQILISNDNTAGVLFSSNTKTIKNMDIQLDKGKNKVECIIDRFILCSGNYTLGFAIDNPFIEFYFYEKSVLTFDVLETKLGNSHLITLPDYGSVYMDHDWYINDK